jgi:hypothetical protein
MKKKKGNRVVNRPVRDICSKRVEPRDKKNILRVKNSEEKSLEKTVIFKCCCGKLKSHLHRFVCGI